MKQVLLLDSSLAFRDYLKDKLLQIGIKVETAIGRRDAWTKLLSFMSDLVIIDVQEDIFDLQEFLDKKSEDPNAKKIPIIVAGPVIEREVIAQLAPYGIIKYFTKPLKVDGFLQSVARVFRTNITIDSTPCMLDVHYNSNNIVIDIAQGFNIDKIGLLKIKIAQIIQDHELEAPKVLVIISGMSLCFIDAVNVEMLLDNVIADKHIHRQNVKVLTQDSFIKDLVEGHLVYEGMKVVSHISLALDAFVTMGEGVNVSQEIISNLLTLDDRDIMGAIDLRFTDAPLESSVKKQKQLSIAIVDGDKNTRDFLTITFSSVGIKTVAFESSTAFLEQLGAGFDLVILDLFLPGISGLDLLKRLQDIKSNIKALVYSQIIQKQAIITALQLGAKGYITKPQKPTDILRKVHEILTAK